MLCSFAFSPVYKNRSHTEPLNIMKLCKVSECTFTFLGILVRSIAPVRCMSVMKKGPQLSDKSISLI